MSFIIHLYALQSFKISTPYLDRFVVHVSNIDNLYSRQALYSRGTVITCLNYARLQIIGENNDLNNGSFCLKLFK